MGRSEPDALPACAHLEAPTSTSSPSSADGGALEQAGDEGVSAFPSARDCDKQLHIAGSAPGMRKASGFAVSAAKIAYSAYERRLRFFDAGLFADPAWNMLLDLFIATETGRRLSVTAVCLGSRSSTATALRYLGLLIDAGLVVRTADERDRRRSFVWLTEQGRDRMANYFK